MWSGLNNNLEHDMSILNITNLTDNPERMISEKFMDAFGELESELGITIDASEKREFIESQIESLEERANETVGSELLNLIDNYLVNLDYYSEVKEWHESKESNG